MDIDWVEVLILLASYCLEMMLFFFQCRASIDEGRTLKNILATYKDASGQAINYGKSAFMCS